MKTNDIFQTKQAFKFPNLKHFPCFMAKAYAWGSICILSHWHLGNDLFLLFVLDL